MMAAAFCHSFVKIAAQVDYDGFFLPRINTVYGKERMHERARAIITNGTLPPAQLSGGGENRL